MAIRVTISLGLALVIGWLCLVPARGDEQSTESKPFPAASVRFEQNATDGDVEVVFDVTGPEDGLTKLTVVGPDGRTVVDFASPQASRFGIREFVFESPEPTDVESLKAAFPAGEYTFDGANAAGAKFHGTSPLNHQLPPPTSFLHPANRAQDVEVDNLEITWTPVESAVGYVIELEQPKLDMKVIVNQPATQARFFVPKGLLLPGTRYHLGIGTVSADKNVSFIETSFTTASGE